MNSVLKRVRNYQEEIRGKKGSMDELNNHLDMAEERTGELEDLKEFYPEKQLENMKTKSRDTREPALCAPGVSGDGATHLVIEDPKQDKLTSGHVAAELLGDWVLRAAAPLERQQWT